MVDTSVRPEQAYSELVDVTQRDVIKGGPPGLGEDDDEDWFGAEDTPQTEIAVTAEATVAQARLSDTAATNPRPNLPLQTPGASGSGSAGMSCNFGLFASLKQTWHRNEQGHSEL